MPPQIEGGGNKISNDNSSLQHERRILMVFVMTWVTDDTLGDFPYQLGVSILTHTSEHQSHFFFVSEN